MNRWPREIFLHWIWAVCLYLHLFTRPSCISLSFSRSLYYQVCVHNLPLFHTLAPSLRFKPVHARTLSWSSKRETVTRQLTGPFQSDKFWCKSFAAARIGWSVPVGSPVRWRRQCSAVWISSGERRAHSDRACALPLQHGWVQHSEETRATGRECRATARGGGRFIGSFVAFAGTLDVWGE